MKHFDRRTARTLAFVAAIVASLGLATAQLPIPTTAQDFKQPGTQPNTLLQPVYDSQACQGCHSGYDPNQEPYTRWSASMMAQSSRDPVFWAALTIANQDMAGSGEYCLRCHTPGAWLDGRCTPADGSALNQAQGDFDGVTCHVCHRMVDPVLSPENPPIDERILQRVGTLPPTPNSGQYIIDPLDVRRGPFDLGPNFFFHEWLQSPYHRESQMCGTCHEVSNPGMTKQLDGTYALNALNAQHPTHNEYDQFPVERLYSEWAKSEYAKGKVETADAAYPTGRFGGNVSQVATCQDCHMPKTTGTACQPVLGGAVRPDLPLHDFNAVNSWVLDAVRQTFPDSETGLTNASVAAAHARTNEMQQRASDLKVWSDAGQLGVRIVNQTGHKLPSGYAEGRRIWINVKFFDAGNALVAERGAYDLATATLTTNDTKVYEAKYGIDAAQSVVTGLPAGESFHFVLNNVVMSDNRIPPRGFTNPGFDSVQSKPVAYAYAEEQYWDDTYFAVPLGATSVTVTTYHQTTSKEYIEFLKNNGPINGPGVTAYNLWVANGKSAPVQMQTRTISLLAPSTIEPIAYGLPKVMSNGGKPRLSWTGSPSILTNNFNLVVSQGLPTASGIVQQCATSNSVPFNGGTLLLGSPRPRIATFLLDGAGATTIPIVVTPLMVGTELNYQAFFRDPLSPQVYALTNAVHVRFTN